MRMLSRLHSALRRKKLKQEIEDELELHLELQTRKYLRSGLTEAEARRRARMALGAKTSVAEECREQRGFSLLGNALRDGRHALRSFRRSPAFALTIVAMVALGVGANSTVFAFCKAMLLASLPVPNPRQLYLVSIQVPGIPTDAHFSFPDLQKMQRTANQAANLTGFTEVVEYHLRDDAGTSSTIKGQLVAGNFLSALRVSAIAGRSFSERENDPGRGAVAVLSYRFWQRRFVSNRSIIGKRLLIQRHPVTVVAILPPGFDGVEPGVQPDLWMPLSVQAAIGFDGYASMNGIDWNKPWLWQDVSWLHVLARSPADHGGRRLQALLAND